MAHFASVTSGGYLVCNTISFLLLSGFILFGLVGAVAGLGKRRAPGKEVA